MAIDTKVPIGRFLLVGLALAAFGAAPAGAQTAERLISNPRVLGEGIAPESLTPTVRALPHEKVLNLNIVYTDGQLFNPTTYRYDKVHLRSYNGTDVDKEAPYVSPTIEAVPGDTIRVNLNNQLPDDPSCAVDDHGHNGPHCFNGTNLHTHGLWVNPAGNGDNVLLSINPGVKFQYEYNIPGDHPAGTFWYHTHRHGSTALQVSSGMAGALIIRGSRLPTKDTRGDLDTLLAGLPDRVLVFQQIQYACRDTRGLVKTYEDGTYRCDEEDVGTIENYDVFAPGKWFASGRYTSINGVVTPTFQAKQGQVERWRMIHGGVRDTISLKVVKTQLPDQLAARLSAPMSKAETQDIVKQYCTGATIPYYLVAADGLTMAAAQPKDVAVFQPGYRFDALMTFPEAGVYCLIDASSPAAGTVNGDAIANPSLLGFVIADPGTAVPDIPSHVTDALVAAAQAKMPDDVASAVVADLRDGLKLSKFVPHLDIAESEVTGQQELTFFIDTTAKPTAFEVSNTLNEADAEPYDPATVNRLLKLGGVDEWTMQSHFVSHPFHIHVNPFQIVSILDPNGKDVSALGAIDDAGGTVDPEYPGLKGVWKDTLWIKSLLPSDAKGLYTIKIRTRYERYIGEFVLHCHILDHEDNGMMQNVAIVLPDGNIAASGAGAAPLQLQGGHTQHKP
ncbi:MAG: multicopper oxidase domain-containing protein [Inquilinus limosus]|uniref:Multicopper oxidase domain-containing protein n=1 Tax=Inquilinus limosus TaxID=171674 RepID=A0A952FLW3_9PROT|nr:multicopper oxidase domain-containing protein [Inquilinus limosus]